MTTPVPAGQVVSFDRKAFTVSCLALASLAARVREQASTIPGPYTRALREVISAHILYGQPEVDVPDDDSDIEDARKLAESEADRLIAWASQRSFTLTSDKDLPTVQAEIAAYRGGPVLDPHTEALYRDEQADYDG